MLSGLNRCVRMNTTEMIAVIAIVLIVGGAVAYIIKAKKNGQKCIGCPYSKQCSGKCNGGCNHDKSER